MDEEYMGEERVLDELKGDRKKSIAVLYICTGKYCVFWKDFYLNFEEHFCPDYEKHYFVFSDCLDLDYKDKENVTLKRIDNQPWPLITLLRFDIFLSVENELKAYDYIMFANSNIRCRKVVEASEFLPNRDNGEKLTVVQHPGYAWCNKIDYPYERSNKSLAYIPWNCGEKYVIGAIYIGERDSFLELSERLSRNVREDLKNRVIAIFHDESHLNRYIIGRKDVKIAGPSYCYPTNTDIPVEEIIGGEDKAKYFNVNMMKNTSQDIEIPLSLFGRVRRRILSNNAFKKLLVFRDSVLGRKII